LIKQCENGEWQYFKIINLDEELFDNVCLTFHFMEFGRQSICFANNRQIFEMNFQSDSLKVLAEFKTPLNFQPDYFVMSDDQQFVIIATPDDAIYFNRLTNTEIDLDELHNIAMLKCMIYDGEARSFYILANKFEEKQ
jgi:hypothetical protein